MQILVCRHGIKKGTANLAKAGRWHLRRVIFRGFRLCLADEVFQQLEFAIGKRGAAGAVARTITSYRHSERVSGSPIAT